jgi:2-hydroxy-3-oxopropionate reductase
MQPKIGFVGLGTMGKPIAMNIANAGFDLTVFDLRDDPCRELAALGAKVAASPRQIAENSDIVEIVVVDDDQTEEVVGGRDGLLDAARSGSVVAVHSTVLPQTVTRLAERCAARGVAMIDAPVSGGQQGARDKNLCYMVGGDSAALERCRPVFATSAKTIFHLGALGMGATAKMLIQIVVCLNMVAAQECELICDKTGLRFEMLQQVLHVSAGQSFVLDHWLGRFKKAEDCEPVRRHREEVFAQSLLPALELARDLGVELPGAAIARDLMKGIFGSR